MTKKKRLPTQSLALENRECWFNEQMAATTQKLFPIGSTASVQSIEAVSAWVSWMYDFCQYRQKALLASARSTGKARPGTSANLIMAGVIESLQLFVREYLPKSCIASGGHEFPEITHFLSTSLNSQLRAKLRSEFWDDYCVQRQTIHYDTSGRVRKLGKRAARLNNDVSEMLEFAAAKITSHSRLSSKIERTEPVKYRNHLPLRTVSGKIVVVAEDGEKVTRSRRNSDKNLLWLQRDYPLLQAWLKPAQEFIASSKANVSVRLTAISVFVGKYLARAGDPSGPAAELDCDVAQDPIRFLMRDVHRAGLVPNTLSECTSVQAVRTAAFDFLEHILLHECSEFDESGPVRLPEFANPFKGVEKGKGSKAGGLETIRSAMPYAWVKELRRVLVEGAHFSDWKWAQQAKKSGNGRSVDWYEVDQSLIDTEDKDCVWRKRTTGDKRSGTLREFYEIWSPVRWVALVVKLSTALRTGQVRALDSGESDLWYFDLQEWAKEQDDGRSWRARDLAASNKELADHIAIQQQLWKAGGKPYPQVWRNGALRRCEGHTEKGLAALTVLYFNTNKTADNKLEGAAKGFEVPLPVPRCPLTLKDGILSEPEHTSSAERDTWLDDLGENTYWWIAKLRDWQSRYNKIVKRADWKELAGTGLFTEKTEDQFSLYLPTCFLFREPATQLHVESVSHPISDAAVSNAWWSLNAELQIRFFKRGKRNLDGSPIELVYDLEGLTRKCHFDLHSIRVSLITALVIDGGVPLDIVQKLVGHSRILMTIYYVKLNREQMRAALAEGLKRMKEKAAATEFQYLKSASADDVRSSFACNDESSAFAALGVDRGADKRATGWVEMMDGICPVGRNTRLTAEGTIKAGCFNGGPQLKREGSNRATYAPVEGGAGNCPNCRWFVTSPAYLNGLVARFDVTQFRIHESDTRAKTLESEYRRRLASLDQDALSVNGRNDGAELERRADAAERELEMVLEQSRDLKVTLGNTYKLIQRCLEILNRGSGSTAGSLVLSGGIEEWGAILEETTSEMLQLCKVAEHSDVFPEMDPGKAILKRSQIINRRLCAEGVDPQLLLSFSEEQQAQAGSLLLRQLGARLNPGDADAGLRSAVKVIEGPESVAAALGIRRGELQGFIKSCALGNSTSIDIQRRLDHLFLE